MYIVKFVPREKASVITGVVGDRRWWIDKRTICTVNRSREGEPVPSSDVLITSKIRKTGEKINAAMYGTVVVLMKMQNTRPGVEFKSTICASNVDSKKW